MRFRSSFFALINGLLGFDTCCCRSRKRKKKEIVLCVFRSHCMEGKANEG